MANRVRLYADLTIVAEARAGREPCRSRRSQSCRRNLRRLRAASGCSPRSPCRLRNARERLSDSAARSRTLVARRRISR
jgi:hypothetical protein